VPEDALGELSLEVTPWPTCCRISAFAPWKPLPSAQVVKSRNAALHLFASLVLQLVNSAGERLLQQPSVRLLAGPPPNSVWKIV